MQLQFSWLGKLHCFCYHSSEVTIKLNQERSCSFRISMDTVCYAELPWERNWLWIPFPYISDWFVAAFWSLETGSRWKRLCTFCSIHRNVSSELGVEYELWTMNFIIESRGCVVLLDELITMTTKRNIHETTKCSFLHDDVIKWKLCPRYWPLVRGITHRSPVNSPHKGQWRGALILLYLRLNKR